MEYGIMSGNDRYGHALCQVGKTGYAGVSRHSIGHTPAYGIVQNLAEGGIFAGLSLRHSRYAKLCLWKFIALILKHILEPCRVLFDFFMVIGDCLLI